LVLSKRHPAPNETIFSDHVTVEANNACMFQNLS
jgi:hypothetical protein